MANALKRAVTKLPRKTLGWKTPAEALNTTSQDQPSNSVLRRPLESAQGISQVFVERWTAAILWCH